MLRQHSLIRRCFSAKSAPATEEEWAKQFAVFCKQLQNGKLSKEFKQNLTTAFVLPDLQVDLDKNGNKMNIKNFFLEQRRLYMKRKLLPHRQWQLERFGIPLEWPRRPAWRGNNILTTDYGSGRERSLGESNPSFDPFEDPSWTDKQMKLPRSEFLKNQEFAEWFNQMPSILRQVRIAGKPKQQVDEEGNLIHHERAGIYAIDDHGNPVPEQDDMTHEDFLGLEKRTVFKPAMPRRKRAMILLKALQQEKIMPEHLMHQELDMLIYQILKLNRFDPDIPNKRGILTEKATYRASRARADKHYVQNERTKAARIRGYLEWFWRNTEEGKRIMRERRQKAQANSAHEKDVRESLLKLREEQSKLRKELDDATKNIEALTELIESCPGFVYAKIDTEGEGSQQNLLDRRWKWLMHKEDKLNDFKRVEDIFNYFEFRLSAYEEPLEVEVQRFPYSDLVYDSPWPTEDERRILEQENGTRQYWDTDETYSAKVQNLS